MAYPYHNTPDEYDLHIDVCDSMEGNRDNELSTLETTPAFGQRKWHEETASCSYSDDSYSSQQHGCWTSSETSVPSPLAEPYQLYDFNQPSSIDSSGYSSMAHVSINAPKAGSRKSKKIKWHEMPPQSDPELEQKRLRAVKNRKDRERRQRQEEELKTSLASVSKQVAHLSLERGRLQQTISDMELSLLAHGQSSCPPRSEADQDFL